MMEDVYMMGVDRETYEKLLAKAKKENKSVAEVASDALRQFSDEKLEESKSDRKLLMEG